LTKHQTTEETQKNILRVAETLFMELGYQAVSTRQVARECGISQPTLYYHFADKRELYVAVLLEALRRINQRLGEITGGNNLSIEEKLGGVAVYMMRQTYHDINLRNMLHDIEAELDEASRSKVAEEFFRSMILPIVKVLQEVPRPEGGLPVVKLAFVFLNIISTGGDREFQQMRDRVNLPETLDHEAKRLTHFFLHGLLHD
jgi:AcrR family transcriptional regulator